MQILKNTAIIVQGPTNYLNFFKKAFNEIETKLIFSTWKNENYFFDSNDIFALSDYPKNAATHNLNYQKTTTLKGIEIAEQIGVKYVLKIRSDMIPTSPIDFLNSFDFNCMNFLCWHKHENGYFVDYFMGGPIADIKELWNFEDNNFLYPEQAITQQFFKKLKNKKFSFILDTLNPINDIYWIKNNIFLSSYKNDMLFTTKICQTQQL